MAIAAGHRVGFNQQPGHRAPDEQFTTEQAHSSRREELRRTRDGEGRHVHHALLLHVLHAHRARVLLPVSVGRQATTSVRVPLRACPALPEQAVTPAV